MLLFCVRVRLLRFDGLISIAILEIVSIDSTFALAAVRSSRISAGHRGKVRLAMIGKSFQG